MNRRLALLLPVALGLAGAMAVLLVGGLNWLAAGLALGRQMAAWHSASTNSIAHYLAAQQEFGAQVAPVWSGHIESSRSQMESAISALSQRFIPIPFTVRNLTLKEKLHGYRQEIHCKSRRPV